MAIKAVNATQLDADLTTVANAIRTKGGTSAPLSFPSGMASAIGAISTGITPTGTINITTNGTHDVTSKATANVQVPTGTPRSSADLTVSGRTVTVPAGLYSDAASKSVLVGTQGTPTATKSISGTTATVTPRATGTTGYITGTTKIGTAVTVTAAELDTLGTKSINANGTGIDVTGYSAVDVAVPGSEITAEPLSVTENGTYTAPTGKAYSPVTINVPTGTPRSSSDLTVSGATVTVPAGLYSVQATKSVAQGTAGTPTASKGSVSNHSISVTPSVTNSTGYITGGTKSGSAVTVSASELVSGTRSITSNGTGIDVTNYKYVDVSVMSGGGRIGDPVTMTYSSSTASSATGYYHYRVARVETDHLIGFFAYPSYRVTSHEGEEYDYLVSVYYNVAEDNGVVGYLYAGSSYVRYYAESISENSDRMSVNVGSFDDVSISTPVSQSGNFLMFADDSAWNLIPIYSQ